ncbi:hypothetical protein PAHAL_9G203100 [Panicum hallii]|uniref:VWFA domain-containing protein n=1 Tax=Panicum hallii TaxID=206008 RepID=A0A2T8I1V0_9POAL|nr:hypothetical protein PAHAL_9G203100 [Panicum hallii]
MASATADPCAICLGEISRGQAVFATWRDVPAVEQPVPAPAMPPPRAYADDDPVAQAAVQAPEVGEMALKTHCEFPPVARDASCDSFAVLVHATAPGAAAADAEAPRAPLDLVTVLDVSGSMTGNKLALPKQAMRFVIDNLAPPTVLAIRLVRMSDDGKASTKRAVESLVAGGSTNIGSGLHVASEVLADRRYRNAVTSVILLSDGQDTCIRHRDFTELVPLPFRAAVNRPGPIHTFGFGSDHDAAAMHTVAEDSFAQCIGGLLSVVEQDARVVVECAHPGVRVREVKSGRYESRIDADGRAASVEVGELYAEEERRFLLFVDVPVAEATEDATQLVKVRCTYREVATGRAAVVGDDAVVQRPAEVTDPEASVEVERERVRVAAAEEIAAARAAAERCAFEEAGRILHGQLYRVHVSLESAPGGNPMLDVLEEELEELEECMEDEEEYERVGRARVLKGLSSHAQQRASYVAVRKRSASKRERERAPQPYMTTTMESMVKKSQKLREEHPTSPPPLPEKRKRGSDRS